MRKIYLDGQGHKVAAPVSSKEQYFAIRNTVSNRENLMKAHQGDEDAKRRLVQFNYNDLLPDGRLAGCCHPSSYFAGDVDCEGLAASKEIAQRFLAHKDEIGLMELSRSARYGLHYVCRRQMGRTILENQVRVALITKTEMDTSAHDLQRVMFTVTADSDELLYLDDAIFQEPLTIEESEREYEQLKEREREGLEEVPAGAKKANKHYRPWEEEMADGGCLKEDVPQPSAIIHQPSALEDLQRHSLFLNHQRVVAPARRRTQGGCAQHCPAQVGRTPARHLRQSSGCAPGGDAPSGTLRQRAPQHQRLGLQGTAQGLDHGDEGGAEYP